MKSFGSQWQSSQSPTRHDRGALPSKLSHVHFISDQTVRFLRAQFKCVFSSHSSLHIHNTHTHTFYFSSIVSFPYSLHPFLSLSHSFSLPLSISFHLSLQYQARFHRAKSCFHHANGSFVIETALKTVYFQWTTSICIFIRFDVG